jgi:hypothetical protein
MESRMTEIKIDAEIVPLPKRRQSPDSIEIAVRAITAKFAEADALDEKAQNTFNKALSARLEAGHMLNRLRKRVEGGEDGNDIDWWTWYGQHFSRSRKDAERLMRIAAAKEPEAALATDRAEARERMRKHRAAQSEAWNGANVRSKSETKPPINRRAEYAEVVDDAVEPKGRKRRAERDRDRFVEGFKPFLHGLGMVTYSSEALGLLTPEQKAEAVEDIGFVIEALMDIRDRLRKA